MRDEEEKKVYHRKEKMRKMEIIEQSREGWRKRG